MWAESPTRPSTARPRSGWWLMCVGLWSHCKMGLQRQASPFLRPQEITPSTLRTTRTKWLEFRFNSHEVFRFVWIISQINRFSDFLLNCLGFCILRASHCISPRANSKLEREFKRFPHKWLQNRSIYIFFSFWYNGWISIYKSNKHNYAK